MLILCVLTPVAHAQPLSAGDLVGRLQQTRAVNIEAVVQKQFTEVAAARGFRVTDPYRGQAADIVERWYQAPTSKSEVCAILFTDAERIAYDLRGFASPAAASVAGFTVTHQGRCGTCSTLRDLAVYLSTPDLTTPARHCARRIGLERKKRCFEEEIGLTPWCAESWAYNADNTRDECLGTCMADYGFFNLLLGRYPGSNADASGQLRPCLQCDEEKSGPGFKYSAGRTRRNSGIESAITRPGSELFKVDHGAYFGEK
ncbi:MAG: hypothetical protein PVF46_04295 [Lysobacterales bacterium]